jgi:hypothetical protein
MGIYGAKGCLIPSATKKCAHLFLNLRDFKQFT